MGLMKHRSTLLLLVAGLVVASQSGKSFLLYSTICLTLNHSSDHLSQLRVWPSSSGECLRADVQPDEQTDSVSAWADVRLQC